MDNSPADRCSSDSPPTKISDVPEKTSIAIADPGSKGEVRLHSEVATTQVALDRAIRRIAKSKNISVSQISICYEAGGCGMWIARMFMKMKAPCTVIAPSLIPIKSGDHVKTDKKDAIKLARVDAIDDHRRAKTRLLALLRRLGFNYSGKTTWTDAHRRYLRALSLPFPAHGVILEELIGQIDQLEARIARYESHMEHLYADWRHKPIVDAVMGLKGFQMIAAMMIVSEVGDFVRFTHPKQLMSYLGLTPGEYSSGGKSKRTGITKCGNSHARWILVECSTHYSKEAKISAHLSKRQENLPRWIREISWTAQNRL